MHIYIYIYVHICMYVCIYIYIYILFSLECFWENAICPRRMTDKYHGDVQRRRIRTKSVQTDIIIYIYIYVYGDLTRFTNYTFNNKVESTKQTQKTNLTLLAIYSCVYN